MKSLKSLTLALTLAASAGAAQANLISNGSFDASVGLSNGAWGVYSNIPGWTTYSGSGIEVQRNTTTTAHSGSQYVELDSRSNSSMYQQISGLSVGQTYSLSFWYKARTSSSNDNGIDVFWGNTLPGVLSYSVAGLTASSTPNWLEMTTQLTATASSMYLVFGATGISNSLGGYIDTVSLVSVAEPTTLGLMGLGFAGLLMVRRARKQA